MAYKSRYTRSTRSYSRPQNPQKRLIITVIIAGVILYVTVFWILPALINGIGFFTDIFKSSKHKTQVSENATLAPPVFNIPFEATNTGQLTFTGFATPNTKVELYLDNELRETLKTSFDGSFTFQNIDLALGTNNIFGKTLDDKNKESLPSKTIQLLYDGEKPKLELTEPEDGRQVQGTRQLNVSGVTDPDAQIYINDSQVIVKSDGTFTNQFNLSDGDNNIIIKAKDKAGNTTELARKIHFQP